MIRFLIFTLSLGAIGYGIWKVGLEHPEIQNKVSDVLAMGEFHTLELRYSASQIMEAHRRELLKSNRHKYLEAKVCFYPYLLMEVKFSISSNKTEESIVLWDLCDGEMVIETKGWEKTHGFGDCITAGTNRHEFKVINFLAKKGGSSDRSSLIKSLHLENDVFDALIDSLRKKQLVVQGGNHYRLHLQKPNLKTTPVTKMDERLVTKTWKNAHRIPKRFSLSQIEKLATSAFGNDFAIRHTTDVYLPVHSISVQNPDGSIHTSLWNALNGKRILYSQTVD